MELGCQQGAAGSAASDPIRFRPRIPVHVDTVRLDQTLDACKNREAPLVHEDVFNESIENYDKASWDEPGPSIRRPIQQYTARLELRSCGTCYLDLALLAPHHIRTQRSNRWKGMVVGPDAH